MSPSKHTLSRCIRQVAAETLIWLRRKVVNQKLFYGCGAANKGSLHHVVKKLVWFDYSNMEFNVVVLDLDVCNGTNVDTESVLDHSLRR